MSNNNDPSPRQVDITLTTDTDLSTDPCKAMYVGGAGNLAYTDRSGVNHTIPVTSFQLVPFGAIAILSTANGTTATDILAVY